MNADMNEANLDEFVPGSEKTVHDEEILVRNTTLDDGRDIWHLVKNSGVLDLNSAYCYLLLCDQFAETCLVGEQNGQVIAFVTAYIKPQDENTLFVWQIGIDQRLRGHGLGKKLLSALLTQPACRHINKIQATVSPSNQASLNLFKSLTRQLKTNFHSEPYYGCEVFPDAEHEQEDLITVGPFTS